MKLGVIKLCPYTVIIDTKNLTNKQLEYVRAIENFKKETLRVPSIREICHLMGKSSTGTIYGVLNKLKKRGYYYDDLAYKNIEGIDILNVLSTLDELQSENEHLLEELTTLKQDIEDNYKRISIEDQL